MFNTFDRNKLKLKSLKEREHDLNLDIITSPLFIVIFELPTSHPLSDLTLFILFSSISSGSTIKTLSSLLGVTIFLTNLNFSSIGEENILSFSSASNFSVW